jgi:hypothetical protein
MSFLTGLALGFIAGLLLGGAAVGAYLQQYVPKSSLNK